MNVVYKHDEPNEVYFSDIPISAVFLRDGEAWLKIYTVATEADDDASEYNCLRLSDGELDFMYSTDEVTLPRSVELTVEW